MSNKVHGAVEEESGDIKLIKKKNLFLPSLNNKLKMT